MTKRAGVGLVALGFLLLWLIGMIVTIPGIEDTLETDAAGRLPADSGALIEFNGRDGYLTVGDGGDADSLKALAEEASGVRDVEIVDDGDGDGDGAGELAGASLDVDFGADGVATGSGVLGALGSGLALDGIDGDFGLDAETDLTDAQVAGLSTAFGLFGSSLESGSVRLADGEIFVTGVAGDDESLAAALAALDGIDGLSADLSLGEADLAAELAAALDQEILDGLRGIQFDSGTANIRAESVPVLDNAAEVLARYEGVPVQVEGHTDDQGSDASNLDLSQRRAEATVAALIERGIEADRLVAVGFGESDPIDTNETPEGRQANRRVEFTILEDN